jgi:hypothetical protein
MKNYGASVTSIGALKATRDSNTRIPGVFTVAPDPGATFISRASAIFTVPVLSIVTLMEPTEISTLF